MKKLLSILGVLSITVPTTTTSVSCTSPYRHWSTFEEKIKNGDTFMIYYHVSGDAGSISFEKDMNYKKQGDSDTYLSQKLSSTYSDYLDKVKEKNSDPNSIQQDDDYILNGFGSQSSNKTIDIEDWSVDSSNDIWQEIWSKRIWSWVRMSLTESYYYKTFESKSQAEATPLTYKTAETMVGNYLSNAGLNTNSSPIFIVIRGGKLVGFNKYHVSSDTPDSTSSVKDFSTEEHRIDDFDDSLNTMFNDENLSNTLVTSINANQGSSS